MEKLIYTLLIFAFLISCQNSTTSVKPEIGKKFEIKFGESVTIQNEQLSVRFEELVEDSRCPDGVTCVWAGNAKIIIQIDSQEAGLNTYFDPKQADLSEYSIRLISLNPYPKHNVNFEKEEYTAEVLVTKK